MGQGFGGVGLPTWMSYKRNLALLPPLSTAQQNYNRYRIPRPASVEPTDQDGLICWGVTGNLPSPEPMPTAGFQIVGEEWREWGRESERVRIENPDDSSQYIIDNRPKTVTFDKATQSSQAGNNTAAEVPPGMSNYVDAAPFIDSSGNKKTKVRMHYTTGSTPSETPVPS